MTPDEIKTIRKGMNLSQTDFARLLGVAQATVSEWEQGKYEVKGAALTLLRVARSRPEALTNLEECEKLRGSHWGNTVNAMLLACESSYRDGSKWHLMQAVFLCVENQIPVPEWIRTAMSEIINGVRTGDVLYWEDALGNVLLPTEEELHIVSKRELEYKAGKREEIMYALDECFKNHIQPPKWLRDAFTNAVKRIYSEIGINEWDDVFGTPFPPNMHIDQQKKASRAKELLFKKLFDRECWLIDAFSNESNDSQDLPKSVTKVVQEVADELGCSIGSVWEYLSEIQDKVPRLEHPDGTIGVWPKSVCKEHIKIINTPKDATNKGEVKSCDD